MSETVEVEIDDIHELMFAEISEEIQEDVSLEDWAEDTVKTLLYQQYKNR